MVDDTLQQLLMCAFSLQESTTFLELLFTDTCKNLVHLLFAQRATTKVQIKDPFDLVV